MLEFVAFSDHHAHNFKYKSYRTTHDRLPGMYNSRLLDCANVLREIREYCAEHRITTALFGGDLFHVRTLVHMDVWNVVQKEIQLFEWAGINLVMIPGNHDYADRAGHIHSLSSLAYMNTDSDRIHVLDSLPYETQALGVFPVPYTDSPTLAKEWLQRAAKQAKASSADHKVLLAHLGMQGAVVGSDYVLISESDIKVPDVDQEAFDLCLFGHFHQHQMLFKNGYFIGATHQHNWSDANTKRGFLHVKMEDSISIEQIETNTSPKFMKLNEQYKGPSPRNVDYVRYFMSKTDRIDSSWDETWEVVDPPEEETTIDLPADHLDPHALLGPWVDQTGEGNEDLKKLGSQLLAEAEGKML